MFYFYFVEELKQRKILTLSVKIIKIKYIFLINYRRNHIEYFSLLNSKVPPIVYSSYELTIQH